MDTRIRIKDILVLLIIGIAMFSLGCWITYNYADKPYKTIRIHIEENIPEIEVH